MHDASIDVSACSESGLGLPLFRRGRIRETFPANDAGTELQFSFLLMEIPVVRRTNRTAESMESREPAPFSQQDPRCRKVLRAAKRLLSEHADWVTFFRRILGPRGIVRREFPSQRDFQKFEQTATHARLQRMLASLREKESTAMDDLEPTRVITVRLPQSLHESLRIEAHGHCTSMNKLCISKLLQFIETELVPCERFRLDSPSRSGRRKGGLKGSEKEKE